MCTLTGKQNSKMKSLDYWRGNFAGCSTSGHEDDNTGSSGENQGGV